VNGTADTNRGIIVTDATSVAPTETEQSLIGRFVALLTPIFAVAAGYLAGIVAQYIPGANLNQAEVTAFMVIAATSALTAAWKWLQGWQQHESLVAHGRDKALKPGPAPSATR